MIDRRYGLSALTAMVFWLVSTPISLVSATSPDGPQPIQKSAFLDWSAYRQRYELADGTQLHEFVAQTYSGSLAPNRLEITFIPRFECVPLISILLTGASASIADQRPITLEIDGQPQAFPALLDTQGNTIRYSFNAPAKAQRDLLRLLDTGNRMKAVVVQQQADEPDQELTEEATDVLPDSELPELDNEQYVISFSLMGSKKSSAAAKNLCESHQPKPVEPK